jgi:molecular chaperone GrpE
METFSAGACPSGRKSQGRRTRRITVTKPNVSPEPQPAGPKGGAAETAKNVQASRPNGAGQDSADSNKDAGAAVLEDLEALRTRAKERDEFLDLLKRTQADFANYQKRNQKEREQERRYLYGPLVLELLPALDNLERATAAAKQAGETGPLVQGVAMVQSQLLDIFRRHGVNPIDAEGKAFDPNLHEAVMQQPSPDKPANTVLQVLEKGFTINERVLRPAKVIVSTK